MMSDPSGYSDLSDLQTAIDAIDAYLAGPRRRNRKNVQS